MQTRFLFLTVMTLVILFTGCKQDGKTSKASDVPAVSEDYASYDGRDRPVIFSDTIQGKDGVAYEITFRGGGIDAAVHVKVRENGTLRFNKEIQAVGRVTQAIQADISGDGQDDLVFATNTEDATSIGNLYGVIKNNDEFRIIQVIPHLPKPYTDSYFGRDSFYIDNGNVMRTFPKYDLNQYNQKKLSGQNWRLTYTYAGRDTISVTSGELYDVQ